MKTGYTGNVQAAYNQVQNIAKHSNANKGDIQALNNQLKNLEKNGNIDKGVLEAFMQTPIDSYTPSVEGAANPAAIERLWTETNHAALAIRKLVNSMLGISDAGGQGFWALRSHGKIKISEADRAQAQELISEDGFFGVKQTTARIMDFAKALVGENASEAQILNMRDAVQKGFDEVANLFGGFDKLPDVSKETYKAVMAAFDEWLGIGSEEASAMEE